MGIAIVKYTEVLYIETAEADAPAKYDIGLYMVFLFFFS